MSVTVRGINKAIHHVRKVVRQEEQKVVESVLAKMVQNLAAATPIDTGEARAGWTITKSGIVNNVGHVSELNEGSSQQAPARFIEAAVLSDPRVKPAGIIIRHTHNEATK